MLRTTNTGTVAMCSCTKCFKMLQASLGQLRPLAMHGWEGLRRRARLARPRGLGIPVQTLALVEVGNSHRMLFFQTTTWALRTVRTGARAWPRRSRALRAAGRRGRPRQQASARGECDAARSRAAACTTALCADRDARTLVH